MICSLTTLFLPSRVLAINDSAIIGLTNNERTAVGLSPLSWNSALSNSAWLKAQDMCAKDYWAHTAPDGATGWTFISQSGYSYTAAGENLARDFSDDAAVVAGWMISPGHRANIMNPAYRDMGVAAISCTLQGEPTSLVVAHYGATTDAAPAPVVETERATPAPSSVRSAPEANIKAAPVTSKADDVTPPKIEVVASPQDLITKLNTEAAKNTVLKIKVINHKIWALTIWTLTSKLNPLNKYF